MASIFGIGLGGRSGSLFGNLSKDEIDTVVNTVIGEAANQGAKGMAAVASVIRNRAAEKGKSPAEIVAEPHQFAAFSNPGAKVQKDMQDPALRAEATQIVQSIFSGDVPDPTDGADHYHADSVTPDWANTMAQTTKIGDHIFYRSGQKSQPVAKVEAPGLPSYDSLMSSFSPDRQQTAPAQTDGQVQNQDGVPTPSTSKRTSPFDSILTPDRRAKGIAGIVSDRPTSESPPDVKPQSAPWLEYDNKSAIRNLPLSPKLTSALDSFLPDMGITVKVFSGGQAKIGTTDRRTGSERHDDGDAGDMLFFKDGRQLDWANPQDRPIFEEIVSRGHAAGITGFGAGPGYMRPGSMHVGFGTPRVWGAGGHAANAPGWLKNAYGTEPTAKPMPTFDEAKANAGKKSQIILDDSFKPADGLKMFGNGATMLGDIQVANKTSADASQASASAQSEQNRMAGFTDMHNREVAAAEQTLTSQAPGRYEVMDPAQADQFEKDWKAKHGSTGLSGDTLRIVTSGVLGVGQSLSAAADVLFSNIPGGDKLLKLSDDIDNWAIGKPLDQKVSDIKETVNASVTDRQKEADPKKYFGGEKGLFGDAWTDPRSYLRLIGESAPAAVATMAPAGLLARGAFLAEVAAGAAPRVAAAAAAKTYLYSNAVGEGLLAGGQSAQSIQDEIAKIPRVQLEQSDAVKSLIKQGMSSDQAVASITKDAKTQAFLVTGVTTGLFSNFGDKALAKILTEGIGGNIAKRAIRGAVRSAVAEGVLEEMPQNVTQQMSENAAMQKVDPSRSLMQDVPEAAMSGLAGGVAMGGPLGATAGMASKSSVEHNATPEISDATVKGDIAGASSEAETTTATPENAAPIDDGYFRVNPDGQDTGAAPAQTPAGADQVAPQQPVAAHATTPVEASQDPAVAPTTREAGPIGRSIGHAERSIAERAQATQTGAPLPNLQKGATVRVDQPGIDPFMGTVDSLEGNEAIIMDASTGELLQVPVEAVTQIAASPADIAAGNHDTSILKPKDALPEKSSDPALEPAAPKAADVTTEPLPPPTQQRPATERFPSAPLPGERVIVDDGNGGRFAATVKTYENGGKEAVVQPDQGEPLQVPTDKLFISNQTPAQVEAENLKRNPPVPRDVSKAGPNARTVNGKTVVMPDDVHARLFDLGRERNLSKKTMGASQLDLGGVGRDAAAKLATDMGISPEAVGTLADDYRYRVERSAKNAQYAGAIKMPEVDPRRLRQWQRDQEKATGAASPATDTNAEWWDGELTAQARRKMLDAAGVKRSEKLRWAGMTPAIREKLLAQKEPATKNQDLFSAETSSEPGAATDTQAMSTTDIAAAGEAVSDQVSAQNDTPPDEWHYPDHIEAAAHEAATSPRNDLPEPTEAQKLAGNYRLGHVKLGGLDISIENPAGSTRSGVDASGKPWSVEMKSHYGYIKGTVGRDKDHVDIFVKPGTADLEDSSPMYVVDQISENGRFDEHKVMAGFDSVDAARQAYLENYTKDWKGLGAITETTLGDFKEWLANGDTSKRFANEQYAVKAREMQRRKMGYPTEETAPQQEAKILQPIENKRPDEKVTRVEPGFISRRPPKRAADESIAFWAANTVLNDGKKSGYEFLMAIDDDGSIVEYGTDRQPDRAGMSRKLAGALYNPDRRLALYHNHPHNTPLSAPDIAILAYPGAYFVAANGHKGRNTSATLTTVAADRARKIGYHSLLNLIGGARQSVLDELDKAKIERADRDAIFEALPAELASRAGIIDFKDNIGHDFGHVPDIEAVLNKATETLKRDFHGSEAAARDADTRLHRSPEPLRHIGTVADVAQGPEQPAEGRSGPGGLAEGSARNGAAEDGREIERNYGRVAATRDNIISAVKGALEDKNPSILATVPLNYFPELANGKLPAIDDYLLVKRKMDAYRSDRHEQAAAIIDKWRKYISLGFFRNNQAKAAHLSDLMHASTLAGIDPSEDRSKLSPEEQKQRSPTDPKYVSLRARYLEMPPLGRELFQEVRDAYREQADETDRLLLDNIRKAQEVAKKHAERDYKARIAAIEAEDANPIDKRRKLEAAKSAYDAANTRGEWASKARMTTLRRMFESNRVEDPYFPLSRFGDYFASVRGKSTVDQNGVIVPGPVMHFGRYESKAEMDRALRDLKSEFDGKDVDITSGRLSKSGEIKSAMDPKVVGEIDRLLQNSGVGNDIRDALYQRWLETMPDLSMRKRAIHRKGTAGFNTDAYRVYASTAFHAGHQMARLKYGVELQENVNQAEEQAKAITDNTREMALVNELQLRHAWVKNPQSGSLVNWLTSLGFVYYMGVSPAAAVVNASQTWMVGLPVIGSRFGFGKSTAALLKASHEFLGAVRNEAKSAKGAGQFLDQLGDLRNTPGLSADDKAAMDAFYQSGLIDRTQSHDLASIGETGTKYNPLRAKLMKVASYAFHKVEVYNRSVTALAAYRLAREAGQSHLEAINTAHTLTYAAHFDMSNSSRPRITQNDTMRALTLFRSFQINMLFRIGRDMYQAVKAESPQARREARWQLAGITGMMALNAGLTGTIGYGFVMAAAEIIRNLFGDDDDPLSFEERFKADVMDILGPRLGGIVLKGVPGELLGIDLTSRIGMPDFWLRSSDRELDGDNLWNYWVEQTAGAGVALGHNFYKGIGMMMDGKVERGIENMVPKFVRDMMRAGRYSVNGVETLRGDEILPAESINWRDLAAQTLGFTPAKIDTAFEINNVMKNAEKRMTDKRKEIVNGFAEAIEKGDDAARERALDRIRKYNESPINRLMPITAQGLRQSLSTRARNRARMVNGVLIKNAALSEFLQDQTASQRNDDNEDGED